MQEWHRLPFEGNHRHVRSCAARHHGVDPDLGVFCGQFTPDGFNDTRVQFTDDAGDISSRPV
jgi:hypothetical protein